MPDKDKKLFTAKRWTDIPMPIPVSMKPGEKVRLPTIEERESTLTEILREYGEITQKQRVKYVDGKMTIVDEE